MALPSESVSANKQDVNHVMRPSGGPATGVIPKVSREARLGGCLPGVTARHAETFMPVKDPQAPELRPRYEVGLACGARHFAAAWTMC